jgi:ArsR family transcriptional regulator
MRNLVKLFKALGDQNRIRILKMLQDKPMSVGELTSVLGISQPGVSRHLRQLAEAGLVEARRQNLWVTYRLTRSSPNQYVPTLLRHIERWANQDIVISRDHTRMGRVGRRRLGRRIGRGRRRTVSSGMA